MLAPNFFTEALRSKEANARDYEQQKNQFKEFMTTTGNDDDKDRYMCATDLLVHNVHGCVCIVGLIPQMIVLLLL